MAPTLNDIRIAKLIDQTIYVSTVWECIGSDEWVFGWKIWYLPKQFKNYKRRAQHIVEKSSFGFTGGATYYGGWDTQKEALEEGVKYALTNLYDHDRADDDQDS